MFSKEALVLFVYQCILLVEFSNISDKIYYISAIGAVRRGGGGKSLGLSLVLSLCNYYLQICAFSMSSQCPLLTASTNILSVHSNDPLPADELMACRVIFSVITAKVSLQLDTTEEYKLMFNIHWTKKLQGKSLIALVIRTGNRSTIGQLCVVSI